MLQGRANIRTGNASSKIMARLRNDRKRSMRIPANQRAAIIDILNTFDAGQRRDPLQSRQDDSKEGVVRELKHLRAGLPIDLFLRYYFLGRKKDFTAEERAYIVQHTYNMIRWKTYLGFLSKKPINWYNKLDAFESEKFQRRRRNPPDEETHMPDHVRVSTNKDLFGLIKQAHGIEESLRICGIMNEEAKLTVRANTIRTTRKDLLKKFKEMGWQCKPTQYAPNGIRFITPPEGNLFATVEFKKGHFEVQDEASQLLAMRVDAKPKQTILDYCAGSGGKTLAFAPFMHNSGQIYLHDIRKSVEVQAKQRLRRAGIQNAQFHHDKVKLRKQLKGKVDWILLDVPCSGSGVMRRNPDLKWKFTLEKLEEVRKVQELILEESRVYLRDENSKIVYSTCSILPEENVLQVAKFCDRHGFKMQDDAYFLTLPQSNGMDGFFSATLIPK